MLKEKKTHVRQPRLEKKCRIRQSVNNGEIAKINVSISDWLSQGKTVEEAAEKLEIVRATNFSKKKSRKQATTGFGSFFMRKIKNKTFDFNSAKGGIDIENRA